MNCWTHRVLILLTIGFIRMDHWSWNCIMAHRSWLYEQADRLGLNRTWLKRPEAAWIRTETRRQVGYPFRSAPSSAATGLNLTLFRTDGTTADIDFGFYRQIHQLCHASSTTLWLWYERPAYRQWQHRLLQEDHFNIPCSFRGALSEICQSL